MSYDAAFFENISDVAQSSAATIVPMMVELVAPATVLDVGCGSGAFAATFGVAGCDVLGVDGTQPHNLMLPLEQFRQVDLTEPLECDQYDLAVCLEVAEHIPQPSAETFIASLCSHAPVVLFSAAIPFQGGEGHVNEQWPDYWIYHFKQHGFVGTGSLRFGLWGKPGVAYWYQQNLFLFAHPERAPGRVRDFIAGAPSYGNWRYVHPEMLGNKMGVTFH